MQVPIEGHKPGPRYGHSMVFILKHEIVANKITELVTQLKISSLTVILWKKIYFLIQKYQPQQVLKNFIPERGPLFFVLLQIYYLILFGGSSNAGQNKNNIIMKDVWN